MGTPVRERVVGGDTSMGEGCRWGHQYGRGLSVGTPVKEVRWRVRVRVVVYGAGQETRSWSVTLGPHHDAS